MTVYTIEYGKGKYVDAVLMNVLTDLPRAEKLASLSVGQSRRVDNGITIVYINDTTGAFSRISKWEV